MPLTFECWTSLLGQSSITQEPHSADSSCEVDRDGVSKMLQCGFEIFFQMLLHGFICTMKYRRLYNNFPYVKSYFNILNRNFFPPVETIDTFLQA